MVYIARHYNMDFALAQPRALRRGLRLVERAGRGGYQNGIPQKTVSNHLPKMPELANPVNADLQRGIIDRNIGDARAEIASNVLGFLIGLCYAAIIKTRCPPASEFRNSETRLSLAMAGRPVVFCIM